MDNQKERRREYGWVDQSSNYALTGTLILMPMGSCSYFWTQVLCLSYHAARIAGGLAVELGWLSCCGLLISENADHVGAIALEILPAKLTGREQEHNAFVKKGQSYALLLFKVVNVLLKLALICVTLRHECHNPLSHYINLVKIKLGFR